MKVIFFIILFLTSILSLADSEQTLRAIELNKQGVELLKKQNFLSAQQKFAEALSAAPYSTELQINLGLAFDGMGSPEKARQAYELAAQQSHFSEARFIANFNIAELAGRQKKIDEALKYYQLALKDKPDSIEAKTNIELLIQNQKNGGGSGQNKDQDQKNDKDKKDQKDQNKDQKDGKDKDQDKNKDDKDKEKQGYQKSKPQPQKFKSEQLNQADVKKILEELDRQEQRVRAEYNKKQIKEKPRDKDW